MQTPRRRAPSPRPQRDAAALQRRSSRAREQTSIDSLQTILSLPSKPPTNTSPRTERPQRRASSSSRSITLTGVSSPNHNTLTRRKSSRNRNEVPARRLSHEDDGNARVPVRRRDSSPPRSPPRDLSRRVSLSDKARREEATRRPSREDDLQSDANTRAPLRPCDSSEITRRASCDMPRERQVMIADAPREKDVSRKVNFAEPAFMQGPLPGDSSDEDEEAVESDVADTPARGRGMGRGPGKRSATPFIRRKLSRDSDDEEEETRERDVWISTCCQCEVLNEMSIVYVDGVDVVPRLGFMTTDGGEVLPRD